MSRRPLKCEHSERMCRPCYLAHRAAQKKAARDADPEKFRAKNRAWNEANADKHRASSRKWAQENLDRVRENMQNWREQNKEEQQAKAREYYLANRDRLRTNAALHRDRQGPAALAHARARTYGTPWADNQIDYVESLLEATRVCANPECALPFYVMANVNQRCVDHCHTTGLVRGILCRGCNTAIGHAKESSERLRALAAYLDLHFAKNKSTTDT